MQHYTVLKRFYSRRSKSYVDPGGDGTYQSPEVLYQPMDEAERDKLLRAGCISEMMEPVQDRGDDDGDD